ncbi:MAG TPA: DUF167 domain-containing protein [Steroidobacteraceae bacterium]|jgi:hypothetical protein
MALSTRIKVYVQPRASKTAIDGMHGDAVRVRIAAAPVDNAANEALVALVANRLGIAKRQVRIVAGAGSRRKVIELQGLSAETALAGLLSEPRQAAHAR